MTTIAPCLWYSEKAEEAARFYVSLLPDSRIDSVTALPADSPAGQAGSVQVVEFTLAGPRHDRGIGPSHPRLAEAALSWILGLNDARLPLLAKNEIKLLVQTIWTEASKEEAGARFSQAKSWYPSEVEKW